MLKRRSCLNGSNHEYYEETYSDQYSVEMFRRTLIQRDTRARQWMQRTYRKTMLGWLHNHPNNEAVCRFGDEEHFVALAFEHLWQTPVPRQALNCNTQADVLRYMQAILNAVLLDTLRTSLQPQEIPVSRPYGSAKSAAEELNNRSSSNSDLWETLQALLPNAREQRLAYLLYHCGLKPTEIVQYCPQEFSDVQEIFRLRRDILERVRFILL